MKASKIFSGFSVKEEVSVSDLNKSYIYNQHRFDFVLPDIKLVIEAHGKQHYQVQSFGMDKAEAEIAFQRGVLRDTSKMNAALEVGYTYIVVPYLDEAKITDTYLWDLYKKAKTEDPFKPQESNRKSYLNSEKHKAYLDLCRQRRKEQYSKQKERRKGNANSRRLKNSTDSSDEEE